MVELGSVHNIVCVAKKPFHLAYFPNFILNKEIIVAVLHFHVCNTALFLFVSRLPKNERTPCVRLKQSPKSGFKDGK